MPNDTSLTPNMIQEIPWSQTVQAIKDSVAFTDFATFRAHLETTLPYNSAYTRVRYTSTILRYFFPNASLDNLLRHIWAVYQDDQILEDLMHYQLLSQESTLAQFVLSRLAPLPPGSVIEKSVLEAFIQEIDPKDRSKMVDRLGKILRRIGFMMRERQKNVVAQLNPAKTSLLILIHHLFAPTPRIVPLAEILTHPFWRYLGFRDEETIRYILHEAGAQELIAGYAIVDQLEQITTRYSLEVWLEQALQL
ncbi:MAG: hypothetical protein JXA33_09265 [Anaerolineae bacterium]|nr:hypothetical protein [Anaerolineae bacterium]